ncbi:MAG: glycosyltransferase 87 family protein [Propionicimonas sp.]
MLRMLTPQRWVITGLAAAGVAARLAFFGIQSGDFRAFLSRWYAFILANGHLAALRDDSFANYNTPYLVLLALASYLPVPALTAIKAISVAFDLVLAGVASRLVAAVRPGSVWRPVVAFGAVIFLPTTVMNSGVWAQCDSIYAAGCVAGLLSLVKGRPWAASAWFGVAFAFKLQAIFLLPVLVAVLVINRHRLWPLIAAAATFFFSLLPALLAGRSLASQLMVYPLQVTDSSGTGGAVSSPVFPRGRPPAGGFTLTDGYSFTRNAPTPYAWLPAEASAAWKYAGLALAAAVILAFGIWLLTRHRQLGGAEILLVSATAALIVPLLLPEMHERYFYLAEVLLVLAAFVDVRYALPAAGIQLASISTYLSYFANREVLPLKLMAALALAAGVVAALLLVSTLNRPAPEVDKP